MSYFIYEIFTKINGRDRLNSMFQQNSHINTKQDLIWVIRTRICDQLQKDQLARHTSQNFERTKVHQKTRGLKQ